MNVCTEESQSILINDSLWDVKGEEALRRKGLVDDG